MYGWCYTGVDCWPIRKSTYLIFVSSYSVGETATRWHPLRRFRRIGGSSSPPLADLENQQHLAVRRVRQYTTEDASSQTTQRKIVFHVYVTVLFKCHFLHCDQMPCCQQLGLSRIGTTDLGYCAGARVTSVVAMSNPLTSGDQVTPTSWCNPFIYVAELLSARGIDNSVPFVLFTKSYGQTQFYVAAAYYLKVSLFTL